MTLRDKVIERLKAKGCRELPSNSRKYRKFTHPVQGNYYWVGKAGALRSGKTIGDSVSLGRYIYPEIKGVSNAENS